MIFCETFEIDIYRLWRNAFFLFLKCQLSPVQIAILIEWTGKSQQCTPLHCWAPIVSWYDIKIYLLLLFTSNTHYPLAPPPIDYLESATHKCQGLASPMINGSVTLLNTQAPWVAWTSSSLASYVLRRTCSVQQGRLIRYAHHTRSSSHSHSNWFFRW